MSQFGKYAEEAFFSFNDLFFSPVEGVETWYCRPILVMTKMIPSGWNVGRRRYSRSFLDSVRTSSFQRNFPMVLVRHKTDDDFHSNRHHGPG